MGTTYNQLISDIESYSDRDDLTSVSDQLLDMAEYNVAQDVFPEGVTRYATSALVMGDRLITKPARTLYAEDLRIIVTSNAVPLRKRDYAYLRDFWPNNGTQGQPVIYADMGADYYIVAPTPDAAYTFELRYKERLTPLSAGNQTNFITDEYPNLITFAALLQAAIYLRNADDQVKYQAQYDAEKQRVLGLETKRKIMG